MLRIVNKFFSASFWSSKVVFFANVFWIWILVRWRIAPIWAMLYKILREWLWLLICLILNDCWSWVTLFLFMISIITLSQLLNGRLNIALNFSIFWLLNRRHNWSFIKESRWQLALNFSANMKGSRWLSGGICHLTYIWWHSFGNF